MRTHLIATYLQIAQYSMEMPDQPSLVKRNALSITSNVGLVAAFEAHKAKSARHIQYIVPGREGLESAYVDLKPGY